MYPLYRTVYILGLWPFVLNKVFFLSFFSLYFTAILTARKSYRISASVIMKGTLPRKQTLKFKTILPITGFERGLLASEIAASGKFDCNSWRCLFLVS